MSEDSGYSGSQFEPGVSKVSFSEFDDSVQTIESRIASVQNVNSMSMVSGVSRIILSIPSIGVTTY